MQFVFICTIRFICYFYSGNLLVSDLKDVLTTDRVKKATGDIPQVHFAESDFLKTVVVIVPRFACIKLPPQF